MRDSGTAEPARESNHAASRYPLSHLYAYISGGCNLRCRHCWIEPVHAGGAKGFPCLDPEIFRTVLDEAGPLGLDSVKLTGGEPFLHPRMGEILDIIAGRNISVSVETNGTLCTPEIARRLAGLKDIFVSVSLDGPEPGAHDWLRGVSGAFAAAEKGIRLLVREGIRPQIIMTLYRGNRNKAQALVRMAETAGADSVKFNLLQPIARGIAMSRTEDALTVPELLEFGKWVDNDLSNISSIPVYNPLPPAFRPLGKMFGSKGDGCSTCGILGIIGVLSDGSYALCGIGATMPDMVFGRAPRDRLADVWRNSPVLRELREGLPFRLEGICGECILAGICLGSCIAQNYAIGGRVWEPFWFCSEARRLGRFPETRRRPRQTGVA
ncbi:MAG: SynChlorMet cassette radical SAM/SPASM protein ScmF [Syntrophales bacterium]